MAAGPRRVIGSGAVGVFARRTLVAPVAFPGVVFAGLSVAVIAAEQARQVLGVAETFFDDCRGVGVVEDVLLEPAVVTQDVVDETAEEGDVAAGAAVMSCGGAE